MAFPAILTVLIYEIFAGGYDISNYAEDYRESMG